MTKTEAPVPRLIGTLSERELPVTRPTTAALPRTSFGVEPEIPIPPPLDAGATVLVATPEPAPTAPGTFTPGPLLTPRPAYSAVVPPPVQTALAARGSWELETLLAPEPARTTASPPTFTAEHAVDFLSNLPSCLDEQERCGRVQELLRGITQDESTLAAGLVEEAAQEIVAIRQNLRALEEQFQREQADDELCVQVLEERLVRLRRQLQERKHGTETQRRELKVRLDEMMGVIVFFDRYQGYLRLQKLTPQGETPAFMREDAVKNLLKHNGRLAFV